MPSPCQEDRKILIVVEMEEGEVAATTFELLRAGRILATNVGGMLCSAVLGHQMGKISENIAEFSDEVYCVDSPLIAAFRSDRYTDLLEKLCRHVSPEILLMAHTVNNLDLAPRLAWRLAARLITDCISINIDEETGALLCTKPVYGDRANAVFLSDTKPKMATLRSKSIEPIQEGGRKGKMINLEIPLDQTFDRMEWVRTIPGESVTLDKADAIVAGGRGVKGTEGLKVLEELIDALKKYFEKVELGASRPLVDAGLLPKSRQLGQTGEKASPQLYVSVAISGSSQHVSGIRGSKKIIAINKDAEAPIFEIADYGVVGPYESVVPALIGKLKELS
jgi:electron transfer flavoprotein alpha subunit